MPLEEATAAEAHSRQHLLARMADDVAQHDVAAKPLAHLRQQRAHRLVEPEGHFEGFELAPQWLVVRIVPVPSVDGIGAEEDGPEAEVPHRPARLRDGVVDVERRDHAGAPQPRGVARAEVVEPVVVRTGDGCREFRLRPVDRLGVKPARGIDDADVDAFRIHGLELDLRAPPALVERAKSLAVSLRASATRPSLVGDAVGQALALDLESEVEYVLGEPAERLVLERRIDVALPEVGRLDDVDVAVEDAESVARHDAALLSMRRTSEPSGPHSTAAQSLSAICRVLCAGRDPCPSSLEIPSSSRRA